MVVTGAACAWAALGAKAGAPTISRTRTGKTKDGKAKARGKWGGAVIESVEGKRDSRREVAKARFITESVCAEKRTKGDYNEKSGRLGKKEQKEKLSRD